MGGAFFGVECRPRLTGVVGEPTQESAGKPCSLHDFSESLHKSVQVPCQDGLVGAACCREVARAEGQPGTGRAWSPKTCDVRETDRGLGCRRLSWRWTAEKLWCQWIFSSVKCCRPLLGFPFPPLSRSAEPGWGQCVSSKELSRLRSRLATLEGVAGSGLGHISHSTPETTRRRQRSLSCQHAPFSTITAR